MSAAAFAVLERESLGQATIGLSMSYALSITATLNAIVRMFTEMENSFNAVERVQHYAAIEQEVGVSTLSTFFIIKNKIKDLICIPTCK